MKRSAIALLAVLAGCGGSGSMEGPTPTNDASQEAAPTEAQPASEAGASAFDAGSTDASVELEAEAGPDPCADAGVPASTLACAGLYSDFASQTLSPTAQAYAPAVPLWSDGATKERWIELPAGQQIDATDPNEWVFPIGTKLFKQFTYEGKRVETRMFQKTATNFWVHATYAWNADDSDAPISYGETVPAGADGGTWIIPTPDDCDTCHRGRSDRILGFEQVSLGLAGATGLTLPQLVAQGLVTPAPTQVHLTIGDDGTGLDAPALSWVHINCGVSCHNANENSDGYGAGMLLRLDPTQLDGSPVTSSWDPLRTTIGVPCVSGSIAGQPRIVPGNPASSVIVQLISERGTLQMPPIASRFIDTPDVASVVSWIQAMPHVDAGVADAGRPSGNLDASTDDAADGLGASVPDATLPTEAGPEAGDDANAGQTSDQDAAQAQGSEDAASPPAGDAMSDEDGGADAE